jgi:hypothetical protein
MWPRRLPPSRCRRGFSLYAAWQSAFGPKQVRTRELKEPGEFTCSQCGFYIVIPKANWSFSRSVSKEHIEQNYSAKYLNTSLYPAKRRPGLCRDKAEARRNRPHSCNTQPY